MVICAPVIARARRKIGCVVNKSSKPGTASDDGTAGRTTQTMHPLSRQLALTAASSDGLPRLIAHNDTVYLITPQGEVWRVLDANQPDGEARLAPTNDPSVWARVFVGAGTNPTVRIYRFAADERRVYSAEALYHQLMGSKSGT
jgi:hypothetical protein